jgi:gamma-glutamylcyclotransferase
MASRCPESRYIGRAVLSNYKWQINERGVANIIPRRRSSVHGLVFELGPGDEARLDRAEGVRRDLYTKEYKDLLLYPARERLQMRVQRIIERGGPASPAFQRKYRDNTELGESVHVASNVLVYISDRFTKPGEPRDEYIGRISDGVFDAVALGVPRDFFQTEVWPFFPVRRIPDEIRPTARVQPVVQPPPPRLAERHAPEPIIWHAPGPATRYAPGPATRHAPEPVIRHALEPVVRRVPEPVIWHVREPAMQPWYRRESPERGRQHPIVVNVQPRRETFGENQGCWLCMIGLGRDVLAYERPDRKRKRRAPWYVLG